MSAEMYLICCKFNIQWVLQISEYGLRMFVRENVMSLLYYQPKKFTAVWDFNHDSYMIKDSHSACNNKARNCFFMNIIPECLNKKRDSQNSRFLIQCIIYIALLLLLE